jgi:hypothetical protein
MTKNTQVSDLELTASRNDWPPQKRILCQTVALLLTLEGKCSSRQAKSAHVGCHLPDSRAAG